MGSVVVFDSNIFIYGGAGKLDFVTTEDVEACYASITAIEVLGYHKITAAEARKLMQLLDAYQLIDLSDSIVHKAIELRQLKRMSLGDAIVAATAIELNYPLWTANEDDFSGISGLSVYNPLKHQKL
jgi:predicted nucleic acid-binding protein